MAKYFVEVVMTGCITIEVEACDENEAEDLALEKAEPLMADQWGYDVDCVYRNENDDEKEDEEDA